MSRSEILAAGKDVMDWVRKGGKPDKPPRSRIWLYRWRAFWLERHYRIMAMPDSSAPRFNYIDGAGLVFIMGFWRAGTTLLHELLATLPGFAAPATWQCMDPSAMVLPWRPNPSIPVQRPMDQVMVSTESPQEDEFALMAMGVPSLYLGFLDPRRLPELTSLLDQDYWIGPGRRWISTLETFLAWCSKEQPRHLVVKSPNHLFRYRALAARYPEAKFIWLLRSPVSLWRSNLTMWTAMVDRYALWKHAGSEIQTFLAVALECYRSLLVDLKEEGFPANHRVLSYEDLLDDPGPELDQLLDFLGLAQDASWLENAIGRVRPSPERTQHGFTEGSPMDLLAEIGDLQRRISSSRARPLRR